MSEVKHEVGNMGLNFWNRVVTTATFRFMLLKRAYTKPELERMLDRAGFKTIEVRTSGMGMEAWF